MLLVLTFWIAYSCYKGLFPLYAFHFSPVERIKPERYRKKEVILSGNSTDIKVIYKLIKAYCIGTLCFVGMFLLGILLLIFCMLGCFYGESYGQISQCRVNQSTINGIYRNASDFESHQLAFSFPEKKSNWIHKQVFSQRFRLKNPDTLFSFTPGQFWGFRSEGKDWRFFKNDSYECIYHNGIYVYKQQIIGESTYYLYFFSRTAYSAIYYLNRRFLQQVYADNPRFLRLLQLLKGNSWLSDEAYTGGPPRIAALYHISFTLQP